MTSITKKLAAILSLLIAILSFFVLLTPAAYAIEFSWASPVSGSVLDPTMWSPNGVPALLDTVNFDLGATGYTVSLPPNTSAPAVLSALVGNDTLTLDLGQNRLEVLGATLPAISLGNASGDVANLTVKNGSVAVDNPQGGQDAIGFAAGSTATLTIDGSAGKTSLGDNSQYIGYAGAGTVSVVSGASVDVAQTSYLGDQSGTTGAITVDGAKSTYEAETQYVGYAGNGSVAITNGGNVTVDQNGYLGYQSGTTGTMTVDGPKSTYSVGILSVGESGSGSIAVTNGGAVSVGTTRFDVGNQVGSVGSVSVDGAGSKVSTIRNVGNFGTGSLSVTNGGTAAAESVGTMAGSKGTVTVDGTGSSLTGLSFVGLSGAGSLTVTNGGTVQADTGGLQVGENSGSTGSVSLSGAGTSLNANGVSLGHSGTGTLALSAGAQMTAVGLNVGSNTASGSGVTVDGAGTSLSVSSLGLGSSNLPAGIVTVTGGANLSVTSLSMGETNTMTFDGIGTTGSIQSVSESNPGDLLVIKNGAVVTSNGTFQSSNTVSYGGSATIDGAGSAWNVTNLTTQSSPAGPLVTISNGGALNAQTMLAETPVNVLTGSSLTGSTSLTIESTLTVGANATVSTPALHLLGEVDLGSGGSILVGPMAAAMQNVTPAMNPAPPAGTIQVNTGGVLYGQGALTGSMRNDGGQVSLIDLQQGTSKNFHVTGDFTQTSGTLTLAMAGAPANVSTELFVSGNVALSGVLDLGFLAPQTFPLHVGQTFDLISAGGSFSTAGLTLDAIQITLAGGTRPMPAGFAYTTQLVGGVYSLTVTSVPEPSSVALVGLCVAGLLLRRRTDTPAADRRRG